MSKQNSKVSFEECWGLTIYHLDDLPFKYQELPHIYGRFREKTSKTKIRELF